VFALAWLLPGMVWMWFLTAPGYPVAAAVFAGYHAVAAMVPARGGWRIVARPAAHTLAEALRFSFPFGGVPLATLAISQSAGPLVVVARVGGAILLTWVTFQIGFAIGAATTRQWRVPAIALATVGTIAAVAVIAPTGHATGRSLRIAVVQGGGPQGTRAVDTDPRVVTARHLAATRTIDAGSVDLVLWPENVVDVPDFATSAELGEIAAEAARIGVPFLVGVTEDAPGDRFTNAQVVVTPDGELTGRYDKVRRVPFGEYMPLRGLLAAIGAPTDLVPRNAVAGDDPAYLDLPDGTRVGVVISWEVFFGGRGRDGVSHGGELVVNPTNGSSYTWTVLQTQQVASSKLRAVETGRWVLQGAPTGFSAFVSPTGKVHQRTSISEQKVIVRDVPLRTGRTWYVRVGDAPWIVAAAFAAAVALGVPAISRRRRVAGATGDEVDDQTSTSTVTGPSLTS
jgi:apolipoprotein N-acyltransferase